LILYTTHTTPRLKYTVDFISSILLPEPLIITCEQEVFAAYKGSKINYSHTKVTGNEFLIKPVGLLAEAGIHPQAITCFEANGYKAFFKTTGGDIPFDIFSATFYLLSRYEEYLPFEKDEYGRYAHTNALAFKEGFLHLPLVNIWLAAFKQSLLQQFPDAPFRNAVTQIVPTYDIDMAWSYLHKGWWRNTGGLLKSMLKGNGPQAIQRLKVLRGKEKDPFDAYQWMHNLHRQHRLKPYYFFLLAEKPGRYDKNIAPSNTALQQLVKEIYHQHPVGIHPSWQSGDHEALLPAEIARLQSITGGIINAGRQHYIRFTLPGTFRSLIHAGIEFDFSMGYGSINGFRASVAAPFYWYDLPKEEATSLLLYPFCFMDANAFYEEQLTPAQALTQMQQYYKAIDAVNGLMITLWHNNFLGTDPQFKGWKEAYAAFVEWLDHER
jgi:hypothetical protein